MAPVEYARVQVGTLPARCTLVNGGHDAPGALIEPWTKKSSRIDSQYSPRPKVVQYWLRTMATTASVESKWTHRTKAKSSDY